MGHPHRCKNSLIHSYRIDGPLHLEAGHAHYGDHDQDDGQTEREAKRILLPLPYGDLPDDADRKYQDFRGNKVVHQNHRGVISFIRRVSNQ